MLMPEPEVIKDDAELAEIVFEMKFIAASKEKAGVYVPSKTIEEANERIPPKAAAKFVSKNAGTNFRIVILERQLMTLSITVDDNKYWHLSMSRPGNPMNPVPQKVTDEMAEKLTKLFFPSGCEDIGPQGIYANIRHYTQKYEDTWTESHGDN